MDEFKLIYYEKYNQYYRPVFIDEGKKVCRMVMTSNKKNKSITRDMIAHAEMFPDWEFIIMRNKHITAEENFVNAMHCEREYNRKLNELAEFKRNGLTDSPVAMGELLRIYQSGFGNVKSEKERHFRQRVKNLYIEICTEKAKNDRKATYDQTVPADIMALAREYGLTAERNDEYVVRKGSRVKATKNEKEKIHVKEPCGFLVRDDTGKAVAGNSYNFTAAQTVEFIKKYTTDVQGEKLRKMMTEEVKKETPLEWFMRMVSSEDAKKRQIAVRYNAINGIPEMENVKETILGKALMDTDKEVREEACKTIEQMGWMDEGFKSKLKQAESDRKQAESDRKQAKTKSPLTKKCRVGQIWYMAQRGNPHQCVQIVIVEIVDDKRVRVQRQRVSNKKEEIYVCRADKLHKTPDKTMLSKKDKQKAVLDMNELNMKLRGEEFQGAYPNIKNLDKKVKELRQGYRLYMFKEGEYSITRKGQPRSKFISLKSEEEVLSWIAEKKKEDELLRNKVADKKYINFKGSGYYKIESIGFESRIVKCHYCEDVGKENISEETLIDPETLSELKQSFRIIRNKRYERLRKTGAEKEQKVS